MTNTSREAGDGKVDRARAAIVKQLAERFGIDGSKVLFFKEAPLEPWIPPAELKSIARRSGGFQQIAVRYDKYVPETQQVVCVCEVVTDDGVKYSSFGIATMGESKRAGEDVPTEILAAGRAVSATLNDAGFNPLRSNSVGSSETGTIAEEAAKRVTDIRQIKALATEIGLISGGDDSMYRKWLKAQFSQFYSEREIGSVGGLDAEQRAMVIDKLRTIKTNLSVNQAA